MKIDFSTRILESQDWATLVFLLGFIAIIANKTVFNSRFVEFSRLAFSDKYLKIYKDNSNITSSFSLSMFGVQLISFSFFLLLLAHFFGLAKKTDGILFIQIAVTLSFFIIAKYLIEKIISIVFDIEGFMEQFHLQKMGYRAFMGLLLFPVVLILYYNPLNQPFIYYLLLVILLIFNIITYINILKTNQSLLQHKIFYFILYLCAFEIAPYYFMYYWITKNY